MPSASVVPVVNPARRANPSNGASLDCAKCGKPLVVNGKVKCPRCGQQVELPASLLVLQGEALQAGLPVLQGEALQAGLPEDKWRCPECPAHQKKPRVLAIGGKIKCRWCNAENSLIQGEIKMENINELEQRRQITRNDLRQIIEARLKRAKEVTDRPAEAKLQDIKLLENAYVDFDPDAIQQLFNIPVRFASGNYGNGIASHSLTYLIFFFTIEWDDGSKTEVQFNPVKREAHIEIWDVKYRKRYAFMRIKEIHHVDYSSLQLHHSSRRIFFSKDKEGALGASVFADGTAWAGEI